MSKQKEIVVFREVKVGEYVLRFWPSDNGWMCGITSEMMQALTEQSAQQALDKKAENARELGLDYEPVCNKDPQGCWNVRCQLGKKCKNTPAQQEPVALEAVYETIIHWDEGGGKRSRRELARRIVSLYHASPHCKPLTDEAIATVYWGATGQSLRPQDNVLAHNFARSIEAAHGIKGEA